MRTHEQAHQLVLRALAEIAPDADLGAITDDSDLRDELELDSLDFMAFVERLTASSGARVGEDDYDAFRTVAGGVRFLTAT